MPTYTQELMRCACGQEFFYAGCGPRTEICRECARKRKAQQEVDRYKATAEVVRNSYLWRFYRVTPMRYAEMLFEQGGVCACCGEPEPSGKALAVDHDHSCCPGKKSCGECVRGLLCWGCNVGLGGFRDNIASLEAAVAYLKRS